MSLLVDGVSSDLIKPLVLMSVPENYSAEIMLGGGDHVF